MARTWPDPPADPEGFARAEVESPTGARLALRHHPAETAARCVVCVNHGLAEHSARYARFAAALAKAGVHVYAHDHRGHGATRAPDAPLGVFAKRDGWDQVIADSVFVIEHARAAHPGVPVVVFGHSMGGTIALNVALVRPDVADGFAVWNANVEVGAEALKQMRFVLGLEGLFGARRPSGVMKKLAFGAFNDAFKPNRTEFDWLSRDDAEVDLYVNDPLCGWPASVSLWRDLGVGIARAFDDKRYGAVPHSTPFHLLGGADDPATDGGEAILKLDARLRAMGFDDLSTTVLEDTRHETLNELNRADATKAFVRWLEHVTAG